MKRIVFILLALMMGMSSYAERKLCVVIYETKGQTAFDLAQKPVVSFTDNDVKLVCGELEVLYPLDDYLKMTIEEAELATTVDKPFDSAFTISNEKISASGCESMVLFTPDGKTLASAKASSDGVVSIAIGQLRKGVYVVKTDKNVFKITKK